MGAVAYVHLGREYAMHGSLSGTRLSQRGASAVEYALIAALISVVIIGGVTAFGGAVANLFNLSWPAP